MNVKSIYHKLVKLVKQAYHAHAHTHTIFIHLAKGPEPPDSAADIPH
jgi:hypothetical protein